MSLINEALKKAQRLRTEEAADASGTSHTAGSRVARRNNGHGANTMVLIGSGALVLVVLSVVFTVYLVNRPAKPATPIATAAATKPAPASAPAVGDTSTPTIVAPKITSSPTTPPVTPPATTTPSTTETLVVASTPAPASPTTPPPSLAPPVGTTATTSPVVATPTPSVQPTPAAAAPAASVAAAPAPQPALAPDAPDERVSAFVDAIRVTGIRSSGAESRVLMNERVYRVNDIVERTLGVRLIKAAADRLTFADPRGVTYEKSF